MKPIWIAIAGNAGAGKDTYAELLAQDLRAREFSTSKVLFAGPIKEFAKDVFQFTEEQLYGSSGSRNTPDYRYSLSVPASLSSQLDAIRNRQVAMMRFFAKSPAWIDAVAPDSPGAQALLADTMAEIFSKNEISPRHVLQLLGSEFGRAIDKDIWSLAAQRKAYSNIYTHKQIVITTDLRFCSEIERVKELDGVALYIDRSDALGTGTASVVGHVSEVEMSTPAFQEMVDITVVNDGTLQDLKDTVPEVLLAIQSLMQHD